MKDLSNSVRSLVSEGGTSAAAIESALLIGAQPVGLPLLAAVGVDGGLVSFVLAKLGAVAPPFRHLVAQWALERFDWPGETTIALNMLTWIGAEVRSKADLGRPLARRISDFLVRCSGSRSPSTRLSALDLLVTQHDVIDILSQAAGTEIVSRFEDLLNDPDKLTRDDVRRLRQSIRSRKRTQQYRAEPGDVAAAVASLRASYPPGLSRNHVLALERWSEKLLADEETAASASAKNAVAIEFSVGGNAVELGRFGQLLQAGGNLFAEVEASHFSPRRASQLRPIWATDGSFSVRALAEGAHARQTAEHLEDILANLSLRGERLKESVKSPSVAKRLRGFLDAVVAQEGPVSTSFFGVRAGQTVRRRVLDREQVELARAWLEDAPSTGAEERTFLAVLMAADLSAGTFKCRIDNDEVAGRVRERNILDKVKLGKSYQFVVRETMEERPFGAYRVVELLGLESPDVGELRTSEPDANALPGVCVPQAPLARVRQAVEIIGSGAAPTTDAFGVRRQRNVDYYLAAARVLTFVDRDGELTAAGRLWRKMERDERERLLAIQLELSVVGQAWIRWAGANRLREVEPSTAERFVLEQTSLGDATARTRAGYLRMWLAELLVHLSA